MWRAKRFLKKDDKRLRREPARAHTGLRDVHPSNGRQLWIASYPRSGNTFLRIILREIFGLSTTSIYLGEDKQFKNKTDMLDRIGHIENPDFSAEFIPIKTHELPQDDNPAIYIVRDGRAVLASYFYYLQQISGQGASMEDVIKGLTWAGSWSDHFIAWSPEKRTNTLLVRYESLIGCLDKEIERIRDFLQIEIQAYAVYNNFEKMHDIYPEFFRVGHNASAIDEIKPYTNLFAERHGSVMGHLGYFANELSSE